MKTTILEFKNYLEKCTDLELVVRFNSEVGIRAWGTARACFLEAIRQEFLSRNWDCSSFITPDTMSLKHPLRLERGKIVLG